MSNDARHSSPKDPLSRLLGDRDPLEVARDLFVYAPIGAAIRISKDLPDLIEEGKSKYGMAKVMGTFAAQQGKRQFEERVRTAAQGIWPQPPTGPAASGPASATPPGAPASPAPAAPPQPAAETTAPAPDGDLPIGRYDTLSASQVLSHLSSLTVEQREAVAAHERNTRKRRTILNRIEQLNAAQR
jgi:hypothetical protein